MVPPRAITLRSDNKSAIYFVDVRCLSSQSLCKIELANMVLFKRFLTLFENQICDFVMGQNFTPHKLMQISKQADTSQS